MKNKHLSFEERIIIEEYLNKGENIHTIASKLGKPDSSISREIKRNRYLYRAANDERCKFAYAGCTIVPTPDGCTYELENGHQCRRYSCNNCEYVCSSKLCDRFVAYICPKLNKAPFVCNGCDQSQKCHDNFTPKYKYQAKMAQNMYESTLKDSRTGISLSNEEMQQLDNLVSPLLFSGQSVRAIFFGS